VGPELSKETAMETQQVSSQPSHRVALPETTWDQVNEPGAYVERGSGDLYRVPQEALGPASPIIKKQSLGASRLVKVSSNPFITTLEARMLCAEANISPNF
jgi:hypothetical protein